MTRRRPSDFDLAAQIGVLSFTPRADDLGGLVELLAVAADEDHAEEIERALLRIPEAAAAAAPGWAASVPPLRGRLVRLAGKLGLVPILATACQDEDPRTARNAVIALGRVGDAEEILLARLARPAPPALLRSLAESLGKVGGPRALAALAGVNAAGDPELQRILARARLRLERDGARASGGEVLVDQPLDLDILAACRTGLEAFVCDELEGHIVRPGGVVARLRGAYRDLFRARTFIRAGFPLAEGADLPAILAGAAPLLARLTDGPIRYRLAFLLGGHRRAEVLRVAAAVRELAPSLINDPRESLWDAEVRERAGRFAVTLFPRVEDPRFTYRVRDVNGASHPTIAAALVRAAGIRAGDVVWDPFCGSGTELCEAARAGATSLHGSDLDEEALAAAGENLAAAGAKARLFTQDARGPAPRGTTVVLTNPPLGRRVLAPTDLAPLLAGVVASAARALPPGGRLAWISPLAEHTIAAARAAGLEPGLRQRVDMGGFSAELQVASKRR